jgi:hypothetical protein
VTRRRRVAIVERDASDERKLWELATALSSPHGVALGVLVHDSDILAVVPLA